MRKFRNAAGISQEALADLAGIHRAYVDDVGRVWGFISSLRFDEQRV